MTTTHDLFLRSAQNGKRSKYVELVRALQEFGWTVVTESGLSFQDWYLKYDFAKQDTTTTPNRKRKFTDITDGYVHEEGEISPHANINPIHTVVIGACGFHLHSNLSALNSVGIESAQANKLLLDLSMQAGYTLQSCYASFSRIIRNINMTSKKPSRSHHYNASSTPLPPPAPD